MPADYIPYWDFDAPNIPNEPRDASAATIIASALYELSLYDSENTGRYKERADKILENLTKTTGVRQGKITVSFYFTAQEPNHRTLK